ncbi:MAG: MFS transporter, partial [Alphaproteobacteria bacterium]|nr:MFS transporter [Alphaproteobacteria bacterium]
MRTHPKGLPVLFFTEMWERMSYYGMRAILVLFLASAVTAGGMGLDDKTAAAIYGVYTAAVYLAAMPGGWVADRLLGMKNAVFYGGCIIAAGHFSMAFPWEESFFFGLVLITLGTGLLKPCISTLVGELYRGLPDAKRDAGFSIYYMGINIGAIIGSLVCGYLGENVNWHYGFAASGIGMVIGLVIFKFSGHTLEGIGELERPAPEYYARGWKRVWVSTALFFAAVIGVLAGLIPFDAVTFASFGSAIIAVLAISYFSYIYFAGGLDDAEKGRMKAAGVLFFVAMLFWAGFEQA